MAVARTVAIDRVAHIGIRVRDLDRALAFYGVLGFTVSRRAEGDDVAIILNANAGDPTKNILMDIGEKYPGYTHVALYVVSIPATISALKANDIAITQGPVKFGEDGGVSVFVRDPDRNVIELRGPDQPEIEGVTRYLP
jgi:lactoylglutathione lyase